MKAAQMSVQRCLNREIVLYEFDLGHNVPEGTKNLFCTKGEVTVDHNTVIGWLQEPRPSGKVRKALESGFRDCAPSQRRKSSEYHSESITRAWHW